MEIDRLVVELSDRERAEGSWRQRNYILTVHSLRSVNENGAGGTSNRRQIELQSYVNGETE